MSEWVDMIEDAKLAFQDVRLGVSSRGNGPLKSREEHLREINPGLQELWEQYQVMLTLVDDSLKEDNNGTKQ